MGERNEGQPRSWSCPSCGKGQPAEHKFCTRCGVDAANNGADGSMGGGRAEAKVFPKVDEIDFEALRRNSDDVTIGKLPTAEQIMAAKEKKTKGK